MATLKMLRQGLPRTYKVALCPASIQMRQAPQSLCVVALNAWRKSFIYPVRWHSVEHTRNEANSQTVAQKDFSEVNQESSSSAAQNATSAPNAASGSSEELLKQLEAKSQEIVTLKDRYLRSVADFRNLQTLHEREMKTARDFAIQRFAKDLVDSVDNLSRALQMVPQTRLDAAKAAAEATKADEEAPLAVQCQRDLCNLHEGVGMMEKALLQVMQRHGLERYDPTDQDFNPNEHEAVLMAAQPGKENNTVFFTQQTGFKLNGRVLRPAKVGVVKNP